MRLLPLVIGLPALGAAALPSNLTAQQSGQAIFEQKCIVCHSAGNDRLVGPGLAGVTSRRDRDWLKRFITRPDQMLASGDSIAARLLEEYLVVMPNLGTTDAEADAILAYLDGGDSAGAAGQPVVVTAATEEQVILGQDLFQGTTRLSNGGPTCNSCHEVTNDAVIGGGVLAAELTTVFSRLGGPGVRAILGSPPFPVMQRAYQDKALTEEEVAALVGFLQRADAERELHQPRDYGTQLFAAGVIGMVVLLGLYTLMWGNRKIGSVNQSIYDRQVKSI